MISKTKYFLLFLILVSLSACVDLGFTEVQPVGAREVERLPEYFNGTYTNKEDTIRILSGMAVSGKDTTDLRKSEKLHITLWRGYYFINSKENNQNYWTVIALRKKKDNLELYLPEVEESDLEKLEKDYKIEIIRNEEENVRAYIINPSPENWKKLLKSNFYKKNNFRGI